MHYHNNYAKCFKNLVEKSLKTLPLLFWIALIFSFDTVSMGILTIISAITHELSHIAATAIVTGRFGLNGAFSGIRLRPSKMLSYKEEILIAIAGPLANLIFFTALVPFFEHSYIYTFAMINLLTALSNLLPIYGYDGYRIIYSLISSLKNENCAAVICRSISLSISFILCFLSLYLIAKFNGGYWIFFIFLVNSVKEVKNSARIFF